MRGSVSWGCGKRDDLINTLNFIANLTILYVSVQILNVSRNNVGYNAQIAQSAREINQKLDRKKEK